MVTDEYRSYLLRMWRTQEDGYHWRVLVEEVETGERYGFANLEKLIEFLESLGEEGEQPGKEANHSKS